jgi:Tfp pilus assembly protein PilO
MDLKELNKLDLNTLVAKLKESELFKDKKTLTKIGIFVGAFLISIIIYYSFISPVIDRQEASIELMNKNRQAIESCSSGADEALIQTIEMEPEFFANSVLFHSKEEVEDLYQSISNFALANGLTIVNIKKGNPKGVKDSLGNDDGMMMDDGSGMMIDDGSGMMMDDGSGMMGDGGGCLSDDGSGMMMDDGSGMMMGDGSGMMDDGSGMMDDGSGMMDDGSGGEGEGGPFLYYQIPVDYEIMGTFLGYLKFRRALSKSLKVINFDKEEITALAQPQGNVIAKGTISIVGLPNEYQ